MALGSNRSGSNPSGFEPMKFASMTLRIDGNWMGSKGVASKHWTWIRTMDMDSKIVDSNDRYGFEDDGYEARDMDSKDEDSKGMDSKRMDS